MISYNDNDYEIISKEYYEILMKEKAYIMQSVLPNIRKKIQIAREMGDLSENAEYQTELSNKTRFIQRLEEIKTILNKAVLFDVSNREKDKVQIGAKVKLQNISDHQIITIEIVSSYEVDISKNKISYKSAICKLILGKQVDSIFSLNNREFKILKIEYSV